jgi:type IX secretion system PorP/SprF family membrane protein
MLKRNLQKRQNGITRWLCLPAGKNTGSAVCGQTTYPKNARRANPVFLLLLMVLPCLKTIAQDPVYTQAFLSPLYLNPAATGTGDDDLRISGIARRQWWSVPSDMYFSAFSIDKYVSAIHSGFGLIATNSSQGYLNKNAFYGTYSFHIFPGSGDKICNPPKWFFTGGLQFGFADTRVDYKNLVFGDQINIYGYIPGSVSSANPPIKSGKYYPDFAAGLFFNYNFDDFNRILVGVANHHTNRPDESLVFTSDKIRSVLPMLWTPSIMYTHTSPDAPWSYSLEGIF